MVSPELLIPLAAVPTVYGHFVDVDHLRVGHEADEPAVDVEVGRSVGVVVVRLLGIESAWAGGNVVLNVRAVVDDAAVEIIISVERFEVSVIRGAADGLEPPAVDHLVAGRFRAEVVVPELDAVEVVLVPGDFRRNTSYYCLPRCIRSTDLELPARRA